MVTFEVDFVFCCPSFVPEIFETRFHSIKKNLNLPILCTGDIQRNIFDINNFARGKSMFVCCFDYLIETMYLDTGNCLHYCKSVFYRIVLDNFEYPERNCYTCYRKSIGNS